MTAPPESRKRYTGPVRAVIFDWAGTTVDYGSMAPVDGFIELFRRHGVTVSAEEVRRSMGSYKKDHIRLILAMEPVIEQWQRLNGRSPTADDVELLYREYIPLQTEVIGHHSDLIPGVRETVHWLDRQNIGIGSTTGYTREMMSSLLPRAAGAGFSPQSIVCANEVPAGRPAPWMAIASAMQLGVYPMEACVKVGDTVADIAEGLNAGMWAVGVSMTGNEFGLTLAQVEAMSPSDFASRIRVASKRLLQAGAHFVVEAVAALPPIIGEINERLARCEKP
jgi:phosphonoacetaldehyde hydrolase